MDTSGRHERMVEPAYHKESCSAGRYQKQDQFGRSQTVAAMPTLLEQPSSDLKRLQVRLKNEIECDLADIDIEINSRLVFGIGCIALILIGQVSELFSKAAIC